MTRPMGRVICDITISADGYSAGLHQTENARRRRRWRRLGRQAARRVFDTPDENRPRSTR